MPDRSATHTSLFPRFAAARVHRALTDTPVVLVNGPRQCGKTTLIKDLLGGRRTYLTLDDETLLAAARTDPVGFIRGLERVSIDEVQRAPELMRSIKRVVDEDRRPGRFLLTGSADLLALPRVSESLAGRMETITLLPLSRAELGRRKPSFLARAFEGHVQPVPKTALVTGSDLVDAVLAGGYPEVLARRDPSRRRAWVRDYTRAIVARDVRDIAEIAHLDEVPRLLAALAHQAGQLINYADLAGKLGLDAKTARRYLGILEQVYLVRRIEPWSANRLKRLIKTPKLHFGDTAVLAGFRGVRADNLLADRTSWGALLETFVVSEIAKQLTWTDRQVTLHHYRDKDQLEVDLVLERDDGAVIGIEVKAAASVNERDFSGLRRLQAACGTRFMHGAVVYDGDMAAPFGPALSAVPISALWR